MNDISDLFEQKDNQGLIDLYNEDNQKFSNSLSSIFMKKDNVKLLKHLDNLNILTESAHTVLFECLKSTQVKATTYLNKFLIKDSIEAITFNSLLIHNSLLNKENFNKRIKVLPIIINKISEANFYEIIDESIKGLNNLKKEISAIYLDSTMSNNIIIAQKKIKI